MLVVVITTAACPTVRPNSSASAGKIGSHRRKATELAKAAQASRKTTRLTWASPACEVLFGKGDNDINGFNPKMRNAGFSPIYSAVPPRFFHCQPADMAKLRSWLRMRLQPFTSSGFAGVAGVMVASSTSE
jgi:hypothetical protein